MGMISVVTSIAKQTEKIGVDFPDDFTVDGLRYCGKCRTQKQCRIEIGGNRMVVRCLCTCENREIEKKKEILAREEARMKIDALRMGGISDKGLRNCRFENATNSALIEKCLRYAEHWETAMEENVGMLFWGGTGGGKTYAAACIANALIDRGVPALITSFPRILAAGFDEREELLKKIKKFPLLVLDDLGAERETEAALETVYAVIDERYKSGKPLIVTTNLPLKEIQEPKDMTHKRIYDRILEMCTPVFAPKSEYRKNGASRKMEIAKFILRGEKDGVDDN